MTGPLRIVAHEGTRTGAPAVLLGLLRFARGQLEVPLDVRIRLGGPLAAELSALGDGPTDRPPRAVLVNSSLAADAILEVDAMTPTAVYVHEEGDALLRGLSSDARTALTARADLVMTVSEGSRAALVALGVPPERISILSPLIVPGEAPSDGQMRAARRAMTDRPELPLVIGCGEATWRKGVDLFVAVVGELRRRRPVEAAWIGRRFAAEAVLLDQDARALDIHEHLRWIGEVESPFAHLASADVLVMTSREDPRPMVPMEAALAGTPTAGFAVGGLVDLYERGGALVAPYPDVVALADRLEDLIDDAGLRRSVTDSASTLAAEEQSLDVVGPRFVEHLRDLLAMSTVLTPSTKD